MRQRIGYGFQSSSATRGVSYAKNMTTGICNNGFYASVANGYRHLHYVLQCPSNNMLDEDTELMLRACKYGDSTAFEHLYTKHVPQVMAYLMNTGNYYDATEDIVQEVFTRLWARRREYRGQAKFSTYLYSYVHKVRLEEKRARLRQKMLADGLLRYLLVTAITAHDPAIIVSHTETIALLHHALKQLTGKQRTALTLHYTARISIPEAATATVCSLKCFESRLNRGRKKLRSLLHAQSGVQLMSAIV